MLWLFNLRRRQMHAARCFFPPITSFPAVAACLIACRAAPEAIVRAQLAALQQGDVFGASCFSMWHGKGLSSRKTSEGLSCVPACLPSEPRRAMCSSTSAYSSQDSAEPAAIWECIPLLVLMPLLCDAVCCAVVCCAGLGYHHDALRSKLGQEPYGLLLRHAAVQLGAAALPTQRQLLQEVAVLAADGASARFVWCLSMASHGCWMVSGIFSGEEAADGWRH